MRIVATSGYFDPLTPGHLSCFRDAKKLGDRLVVIVNNDKQSILKKGYSFMPLEDRMAIIAEMKCVDEVVASIDDGLFVCETLRKIKPDIFAKGGEWEIENMPPQMLKVCREIGCKIICGLGENPPIHHSSRYIESLLDNLDYIIKQRDR